MTAYFDPGKIDSFDARSIADSVELQLIASEDSYLSYAEYRDLFPAGSEPSATEMELGFSEVAERSRAIGAHYPFAFDGQGVSIERSGSWKLYALLLILASRGAPFRKDRDWKRSDPIFDVVVLRTFEAKYGRALHFGWPPRGERPTTFPEALSWAAEVMDLKLRSDAQSLPTHRQDGGVDVIAWTPYPDGADGFPIVLVQNTIQQDYSGKPGDVDPQLWRDWINFGGTPGVALAVPYVLAADDPLRPQVVSRLADFMDRTRILGVLASERVEAWSEWVDIEEFVDEQVRAIRADAADAGGAVAPPKARRKKARPPVQSNSSTSRAVT